MLMAEVEQFSYGVTNPILASVMAYVGCLLGLVCTAHARTLPIGRRRGWWLFAGATAIGATGLWLMHMTAMLGFEVEGSSIGFSPWLIVASLGLAIVVVSAGIFFVGYGERSTPRLLIGGILTGVGITGQHMVGVAAVHVNGTFRFDHRLLALSVAISVVAATTALWSTLSARRGVHFLGAALVMAIAVTGTHYTAMAALHVQMADMPHDVPGVAPTAFVIPILLLSIAGLVCLLFCGLSLLGDEDFALRVDPAVLAAPAGSPSRVTGSAAAMSRPPRPLAGGRVTAPPPRFDARPPRPGAESRRPDAPYGPDAPYRPDPANGLDGQPPLRSRRALSTSTSELRRIGTDPERPVTARPSANAEFSDRRPGSMPETPSGRAPVVTPEAADSRRLVTRAELSTQDRG
jgi:NO-binding membrane sensor protein with MHYT domain